MRIPEQARQRAYAVNTAMVQAYRMVGHRIVVEEQNGQNRAGGGKEIIKNLSMELSQTLGKGYSEPSLREFRQSYLTFPELLVIICLTQFLKTFNEWPSPFLKMQFGVRCSPNCIGLIIKGLCVFQM